MSGTDGGSVKATRLGEILVERGCITAAQLDEALEVQAKSGGRRLIGQILISRGYVKAPHVQVALALQKTRHR
jgi:hypothetical protein